MIFVIDLLRRHINISHHCLHECYDCTDWVMFKEACGEDVVDVTCSYAAFCRDMIIPCRCVKVFPNNKPWITTSVKSCIQAKRLALKQGAASELHTGSENRDLKSKAGLHTEAGEQDGYNNLGSAWSSMKAIAGLKHSKTSSIISLDVCIHILMLLILVRKYRK